MSPSRRKSAATGLVVCGALLSAALATDTDTFVLRRSFTSHQSLYYVFERDETAKQNFFLLPAPLVVQQRATEQYRELVQYVQPDGNASILWTLERLQFQKTDRKGDVRYDSLVDQPTPEMRLAAGLIGRGQPVVLRPNGPPEGPASAPAAPPAAKAPTGQAQLGKAPAVQAPATQAAARGAAPSSASAPATGAAKAAAVRPDYNRYRQRSTRPPPGDYDGQRVLERMRLWSTEWLPAGPVRVGDTWRVGIEEPKLTFGRLHHDLQFTLKSVAGPAGRRVATIAIGGACTADAADDEAASEADRKTHKEITLRSASWGGEIRFLVDQGRVDTAVIRSDYDVEALMRSTGESSIDITLGVAEQRTWRIKVSETPPPRPIVVPNNRPAAGTPTGAAGVGSRSAPASGAAATQRTAGRDNHPPWPPSSQGAIRRPPARPPRLPQPTSRPAAAQDHGAR